MRIAFITYEFPQGTGKGGIGTYTSQAANALAAMGWDVHVFAASHKHSGSSMAEGLSRTNGKQRAYLSFEFKISMGLMISIISWEPTTKNWK